MKNDKLIAGFLAALMSLLSIVYPALATPLSQYPSFLGSQGQLQTEVVVGSGAAASDVAGAIDVAANLAQLSYTPVSSTGGTVVNGLEKNTIGISQGLLTDAFPNPVRTAQYSGLQQGTFSYMGNTYNYHEALNLGNTYFSHDFSTSGVNGSEAMVVQTNQVMYQYVFDSALNCTDLANSAKNTCTLSNYEYTNPVQITMLGKPFVIIGVGQNQLVMLSGQVGDATPTVPVTFTSATQQYSVYSDLGANGGSGVGWARVIVKDASGNTVGQQTIYVGNSYQFNSLNIQVQVTSVQALQDGTVVQAGLVVGPIGSTTVKYGTSCDVTSTGSANTKFPGETEWCIEVGTNSVTSAASFAGNAPGIIAGDTINVVYKPQTSPQYFKYTGSTVALPLPNNYGQIGFEGWNYNTFATLSFKEIEGTNAYQLGSGSNTAAVASNLNGIEIDSNVPGSIIGPSNVGYNSAYVLFNQTYGSTVYPVLIGFWDSTNNRVAVDLSNCTAGSSTNVMCADLASAQTTTYNFTISYGGGAALADRQYMKVSVTPATTGYINYFELGTVAIPNGVTLNWTAKTAGSWSSANAPYFRLGTTDSSEDQDIQVQSTATGPGSPATALIGKATQDVVADSGAIVLAPASYTGGNQAEVEIPAQALYVKAFIGTTGTSTTTTTTGVVNKVVAVTTPIARLDTEITAADMAMNFVTVGGPCINSITAAAMNLTYPACGSASGIASGTGLIQVVDGYPGAGLHTVVVAGYSASDTRTASDVLQSWATLLTGINASAVTVTAATAAGITPVAGS